MDYEDYEDEDDEDEDGVENSDEEEEEEEEDGGKDVKAINDAIRGLQLESDSTTIEGSDDGSSGAEKKTKSGVGVGVFLDSQGIAKSEDAVERIGVAV